MRDPGVGIGLLDGAEVRDAGVGDADVDAAERLDRAGDGGVERVLAADVGLEADVAGSGQLGADGLELLGLQPDERDLRPAAGEHARELGPDPARGARDQHGLPRELH